MRELFLLRGHTQRYPPLRSLANHSHSHSLNLWLFVHQDIVPAAVTHLIEAIPHETMAIGEFMARWPTVEPAYDNEEYEPAPRGAGPTFPKLDISWDTRTRREALDLLAGGTTRSDRSMVTETWNAAHGWMARWRTQHPIHSNEQAADAIYLLARLATTASEIWVRIHAAAAALGERTTDLERFDRRVARGGGELRPCRLNDLVRRAGAIADHTADPGLAALAYLVTLTADVEILRDATPNQVARNGSALDGREYLHCINRWELWPQRNPEFDGAGDSSCRNSMTESVVFQ